MTMQILKNNKIIKKIIKETIKTTESDFKTYIQRLNDYIEEDMKNNIFVIYSMTKMSFEKHWK